jgi:putative hydrolase of the HAD superfamily
MTLKKYKHLFFDLDHTLWDFERNSAATLATLFRQYNLADRGITDFEYFRSTYEQHNERLWERYRTGLIRREELRWKRMWLTLIDCKIGDNKLAHALAEHYLALLPQQGILMPYALDILQHCRQRNYRIHLITNGFEQTQLKKLETSGIRHFFEQVITSESSDSLKPHPEIFDYALKSSGAALHESIIIGDTLEADILGGINYGMDQVYYNPYRKPHGHQPTYEVSCLSELKGIF